MPWRYSPRVVSAVLCMGAWAAIDAQPSIRVSQPVLEVGRDPGNASHEFLHIQDAVVDSAGRLFVLDSRNRRVSVFDGSGRLLASAGLGSDTSNGPIGASLAVLPAGQVAVYDPAAARVMVFGLRGGSLTVKRTFPVPSGSVMCAMTDTLVIFALHDRKILHTYTLDGRHLRSFGDPLGNVLPLQEGAANIGGRLACAQRAGIVVIATSMLPDVRAYSPDGRLLWSVTVPAFKLPEITASDRSMDVRIPSGGVDEIVSVLDASRRYVAIQVDRGPYRGGAPKARETILLSAPDGRAVGIQTSIPRLKHLAHSVAIVASNEAIPFASLLPFTIVP